MCSLAARREPEQIMVLAKRDTGRQTSIGALEDNESRKRVCIPHAGECYVIPVIAKCKITLHDRDCLVLLVPQA